MQVVSLEDYSEPEEESLEVYLEVLPVVSPVDCSELEEALPVVSLADYSVPEEELPVDCSEPEEVLQVVFPADYSVPEAVLQVDCSEPEEELQVVFPADYLVLEEVFLVDYSEPEEESLEGPQVESEVVLAGKEAELSARTGPCFAPYIPSVRRR